MKLRRELEVKIDMFTKKRDWMVICCLLLMQSHLKKLRKNNTLPSHSPIICNAIVTGRYSLRVGELSEPVFSDSGIHIILRTA